MKNFIGVIFGLLFIFGCSSKGQAQLLDSLSLDTITAYTSIDSAMKHPEQVIKLILRKQHLKEFPLEILKFKNLQYLDISKNTIKELPDSIDQLNQLQYFICVKTGLERLPKQIGKLSHLKLLNCSQNELEMLPPQIGNLQELKILDLWDNNLSDFPNTLTELNQLEVLDLRNILMSDELQNQIQAMLPKTKIYFSPSCKCKW